MRMNLRSDDAFVEDEGWKKASRRYSEYLRKHRDMKTLFLEVGVGWNTPGIIKMNFWRMTGNWKDAAYICLNTKEDYIPDEIRDKYIGKMVTEMFPQGNQNPIKYVWGKNA